MAIDSRGHFHSEILRVDDVHPGMMTRERLWDGYPSVNDHNYGKSPFTETSSNVSKAMSSKCHKPAICWWLSMASGHSFTVNRQTGDRPYRGSDGSCSSVTCCPNCRGPRGFLSGTWRRHFCCPVMRKTMGNHRKTIGKWWFYGILWDLPSGYVKIAVENHHFF